MWLFVIHLLADGGKFTDPTDDPIRYAVKVFILMVWFLFIAYKIYQIGNIGRDNQS